ncbi:MAG: PP2C family serine/threonine-protein phosphatase [Thermoplasmatota archaeon]
MTQISKPPGNESAPDLGAAMRISGGTRIGRSHRARDVPCQDAFAVWRRADGARVAAAVADGLGSKPQSHHGSRAASDAAVASLAAEPSDRPWDETALVRAFEAARAAVQAAADGLGLAAEELATTLQVAVLDGATGQVHAGMVGDGAIVANDGEVRVLLAPATAGYANEVTPITDASWREDLQLASLPGARSVVLFTDGLTRLLLSRSRQGWQPFSPFFEAFLPQVEGATFDDGLVPRFLAGDDVDRSWDDDKGLVVVSRAP